MTTSTSSDPKHQPSGGPATEGGAQATAPLNSLNSGLIIHRVGQVNRDFQNEALAFGQQLADHMNAALGQAAWTTVYRDLGELANVHWLVHLISPADYGLLINMANNDEEFRHIYEDDRLPERGGGNWERMFVQSSFRERVMVPQHGIVHADAQVTRDANPFALPALFQLPSDVSPSWDSTSAPITLHRRVQASYDSRDLARAYLHEWQTAGNRALPDQVTVAQYEEVWGRQDRLHLLVHLGSPEALDELRRLEETPPGELAEV